MTTPYEMPATRDDYPVIIRWARILLTLALIPLSWHAFHNAYGDIPFISGIDLAIHEFGHMLFMPFGIEFLGHTMMILGGSLIQIVFPLIFMAYFLRDHENSRRDAHAAMICLWWASMNMLSVAMYCADAGPMKLMLISGGTGQEVEGHDWNNLLRIWGVLHHYAGIARAMRAAAWICCVVSIVAGVVVAWNTGRQSSENQPSIG
ncbi:MAG: hypothetical protein ACREN6_06905 [Gemmatimonadaceae bacterium]